MVQRARRDLSAFGELYERYATPVFRYLMVRTGNEQDAQDLMSQTFLAAMQGLASYKPDRPFVAWLMGIASHKVADQYRRRRPVTSLEAAMALPDRQYGTEELAYQHLAVEAVAQRLRAIAPDRAEAVALRLFASLEVGEIAALMGRNEAAVRMLVFRGLRDLQVRLADPQEAGR